MGQVVSIFKNVEKWNRAIEHPSEGNMISPNSKSTVDELISMELDVGLFGQREKILAHVIATSDFDKVVVFSDANGESISRSIPTVNKKFPAHYNAVSLGSMNEFFDKNKAALDEILIQECKLDHGRLTLARALRVMTAENLTATQGLARAISISTRCRKFEDAIRNALSSLYKHYV